MACGSRPRAQAELDDRLKAVADAERETVAFVPRSFNRFFEKRVAEEGGDELAGAVRLVAGAEAARGS